MRKVYLTLSLLVAVLAATSGIARADIPANIQFRAHRDLNDSLWINNAANTFPYAYAAPEWNASGTVLTIHNFPVPFNYKDVWFEIDYLPNYVPPPLPNLMLAAPGSGLIVQDPPVFTGLLATGLHATWHWTLFPQPVEETITFPDNTVFGMIGIGRLDVGTNCAPEPSTFVMAGLGLLALFGVVRKRRRSANG